MLTPFYTTTLHITFIGYLETEVDSNINIKFIPFRTSLPDFYTQLSCLAYFFIIETKSIIIYTQFTDDAYMPLTVDRGP